MIRYLIRSIPGQVRRNKSLYLLTVLGVALGVASVLSIQIINRNALAAFRGSVQAVSGDIDLSILGRTPTFPESLYVAVLGTPGVQRAWPLYRTTVALRATENFFLEVVGVDLFQPLGLPIDSQATNVAEALTRRGWTAIAPALASERGWTVGQSVAVSSGSRTADLFVGALIDFQRLTPLASRKLVIMDLAQAQALFGTVGSINQIDVRLVPGVDTDQVADRLQRRLGSAVEIATPEQREQQVAGLMGAFRLNLTALSLISVFVGLFLIFSSTQASLVRRRTEFGVLRSLGATRTQVLFIILAEVAVLGIGGVAIGLPLGYWVASTNVDVVSATLTNFYLLYEIERLRLPPWLLLLGASIGVGGAMAGALGPALDMGRRDPKALLSAFTLHEKLRTAVVPLAVVGIVVLAASGIWYATGGHDWRPAGFVLAVSMLVGLPLLTPATVQVLSAPFRARDFGFRYSVRSLAVRLQSTSVAVAALAVAVSMLTGITIMVGSFRETVALWIDTSVRADVYVTTESWARAGGNAPFDDDLVRELATSPGVHSIDVMRGFLAHSGPRRIAVAGFDFGSERPELRFQLLEGSPESAWQRLRREGAVLISEPLARKAARWVGDSLRIESVNGPAVFPIAGVYYDYSTELGSAVMDLNTMSARFGEGPINNVALYLDGTTDPEQFVDALRAQFRSEPLVLRSNRDLRTEVFRIFDQTFAITRILQGMCLVIAACGITLTLLVLARERVSELALYRALGAARRQIFLVFVGKGTSMGLLGLILGMVSGLLLAAVLIFVINRAYFGWTIQVHWPWNALMAQAITITLVAVAASLYPALRASRTPASELSREDL